MKKNVAVVAIMKDEGRYLLEWIAHYRSIGVTDIIVYDNESSDEGRELLEKLATAHVIKLHHWLVDNGISPQISAYLDALQVYKGEFEFLAFFDADEFLVQKSGVELSSF